MARVAWVAVGGNIVPDLSGLGQRYSHDDLRLRIADARRFNPDTVMPPYLSTEGLHNVARAQAGKTVLNEQALAAAGSLSLAPALSRAQPAPGPPLLTLQQMTAALVGDAPLRNVGVRLGRWKNCLSCGTKVPTPKSPAQRLPNA